MIPRMRLLLVGSMLASLATLSPVHAVRAQSAAGSGSPDAVADSFFRAWGEARWTDAARLMDLTAFGRLRDEEVRSMRHARVRRMTAEELTKDAPDMPRAVAEYQAAQFNERAGRNDWLMYDYANVSSVDSLAALPVEEAAARWLEAKDERYGYRRAIQEQRSRCNVPDSVFARLFPLPTTSYQLLGTIVKDSLAYALYEESHYVPKSDSLHPPRAGGRRRPDASWAEPPSVLTLRRTGATWRVAPGRPFGGQTSTIIAQCSPLNDQKPPRRAP
jgi:hypothetical protein